MKTPRPVQLNPKRTIRCQRTRTLRTMVTPLLRRLLRQVATVLRRLQPTAVVLRVRPHQRRILRLSLGKKLTNAICRVKRMCWPRPWREQFLQNHRNQFFLVDVYRTIVGPRGKSEDDLYKNVSSLLQQASLPEHKRWVELSMERREDKGKKRIIVKRVVERVDAGNNGAGPAVLL